MIKLVTAISVFIGSSAFAESKKEIVETIRGEAMEIGIDADFAVAVATVESSLNPKAVGDLGEIGLFQLRPEYHDVRKGQTRHNIRVALNYLKDIKAKWEPKVGRAWFVMYNCGPEKPPKLFRERPTETKYFKKVMRELGRIKVQRYLVSN